MSTAIVLVAMTAIAALATAATTTLPSVSIQKFADTLSCSGAVEHHWTVPTETCTATNETHEKDVKAVKMECFQAFGAHESSGPQHSYVAKVAAPASCAQIRPSPNKTCAQLESTFTLECNKCLAEEYGHHMFDCDAATGSVTERIDCDATCTTCTSNKTYTKGECVHFEVKQKDGRKFERNFEFTGVGQCPVRVLEEMYKDATCAGFPDHFFHWESGKCEAGYIFTCSGTDPRPTWKPRPSGAPFPTRPAAVAAKEAHHHGHLPKLNSINAAAAAQSEQLARQFFAAYQKKDFRAMVAVAKQLKHSGRQTKHELLANLTVGPSNPWDWIKCEVCKHIISKIAGTIADVGCEAADPAIDAACGLAPPGFDVACAAAFDVACPVIFNLVVNDHTPINSHLCNDIHWC